MAVFEDLSRNRSRGRHGPHVQASVMQRTVETLRLGLLVLLVGLWLIGAYAGIAYWSLHGSLLGVIVSAIVAGVAAALTWTSYVKLGNQEDS